MAQLRREGERVRRESEKELRNHAARFETLINQAAVGVCLTDADFRIAELNPGALPIFGDIPGGVFAQVRGHQVPSRYIDGDSVPIPPTAQWSGTGEEALATICDLFDEDENGDQNDCLH